jgi:hypothetical protein
VREDDYYRLNGIFSWLAKNVASSAIDSVSFRLFFNRIRSRPYTDVIGDESGPNT